MNKIHLQKEAQHGTPQFRFQAFSQRDTCGQYFAPYHWHDEAEFLYVTEGSITLRTETSTKILSAGQVSFINPGTAHALFGNSVRFPITMHWFLAWNCSASPNTTSARTDIWNLSSPANFCFLRETPSSRRLPCKSGS